MEVMNTDQPTAKAATSSDGSGSPEAKIQQCYKCVFCKRGFSNAQALGGHMNIHRKDRVKLKQTHSGSDVIKPEGVANSPAFVKYASQKGGFMFTEGPILSESGDQYSNCSANWQHGDRFRDTPNDPVNVQELDLELRLGPQPSAGRS